MKPVERVDAFGITRYKYESVGDGDWGFLKYNNKQNMGAFFFYPHRHQPGLLLAFAIPLFALEV